jgi:hypothetical protein
MQKKSPTNTQGNPCTNRTGIGRLMSKRRGDMESTTEGTPIVGTNHVRPAKAARQHKNKPIPDKRQEPTATMCGRYK